MNLNFRRSSLYRTPRPHFSYVMFHWICHCPNSVNLPNKLLLLFSIKSKTKITTAKIRKLWSASTYVYHRLDKVLSIQPLCTCKSLIGSVISCLLMTRPPSSQQMCPLPKASKINFAIKLHENVKLILFFYNNT